MPLLAKQAIGHALHEMSKGSFPSAIDPLHVVNMALGELLNMRSWGWLQRPTTALNLVAGRSTIALPDDYGSMSALYSADELTSSALWVSMEELAFRRVTDPLTNDTVVRYIGQTFDKQEGAYQGIPAPRLEVHPTPAASAVGSLILLYKAGNLACKDGNDNVPIHPMCDLLFVELVRAVAQGLNKGNEAGLSRRLADIAAGPIFNSAAGADIRLYADEPVFNRRNYVTIWPPPQRIQP